MAEKSKSTILQLPLGPLQTNCFLLACNETNQAAVIDPAWDGRGIFREVEERNWKIAYILLTHSHFDHVGGLAELKEISSVPIVMHREAVPLLENAVRAGQLWQISFPKPPPADQFVDDGDQLSLGRLQLDILYTPGHAPGHIAFYLAGEAVLFSGDVLFQRGVGRTDMPGGDHELLMATIERRLLTLPDETLVLPGHGPSTTIGQERQSNPFLG